jgi:hypothetical protein
MRSLRSAGLDLTGGGTLGRESAATTAAGAGEVVDLVAGAGAEAVRDGTLLTATVGGVWPMEEVGVWPASLLLRRSTRRWTSSISS